MVGADTLARGVFMPYELPVGAVTALVGAPVFIVMLRRALRARRPAWRSRGWTWLPPQASRLWRGS